MIELTVKTLDSRNHSFSVPNDFTVKQLKEFIAESVNLPPDSQRLIYCGRVLQDDKNLSEYNVNGKVIHLVQRAPPGSNSSGTDSNAGRTTTSSNTPRRNHSWRTIFQPSGNSGNAMYLGAMAFPADLMDAQGISMPQPRQCLSQSRLAVAVRMLSKASAVLDNLENPSENVTSTPPEENPTSDVSLDPNANTNPIEESSTARISISSRSTVADALRALITPQSSTSTLQNEASGATDTETAPTVSIESGTSRNAGQQTSPISEGQSTQNENPNNNASGGRLVRTPRTMALAELLDLLATVNRRLQPFLSQYHQLMRDDPVLETSESQQRVFGSVSEIMHYLSHGYHALSDIMCDFSLPPPRYLRCRPVLIQHSAVLQTGIPIPTQFSISSSTHSSSQPAANNTSSLDAPPTASSQTVTSENATTAAATTTTASMAITTNTVPPPPRTQPPQERRPLNIPGGFEIFMDVSPGSITIDSLEATVVTNATAATTDANSLGGFTWASPAPPQELMQNLMQVLAHQFMDSGNRSTTQSNSSPTQSSAPGQNSQARGNTATHPTTATQTRSTSRPHVHLSPAMQGLGGSSFDPFLPCNSHHIRSTRRRASHQQTSSANGQPLSQPQSSSTAQSAQSNAAQSGRANTSQEIERSAMRGLSDRPGTPDVFPMTLEVERTVNVSSEMLDNPLASSGQPEDNLTLSIVTQLMERITGGVAQPASTLAQFLQTLPDHSYIVGENIFMDIFMCLAETFTFTELMQLGLGRTDCLIRARPQLQQLLSERLLNKEPASNPSIRAAVDRFNTEFCPFFSILNPTILRDDIDLIATITRFNNEMLPPILEAIFIEDESTYCSNLIANCRNYLNKLCAILLHCCLDGNIGLETIIHNFVCSMTNGIPTSIQGWTITSSLVNFRNFTANLNVPIDEIRSFLVHRVREREQLGITVAAPEPMETEVTAENGISASENMISMDTPIAVSQSPDRINDVVWQGTLPADWVPIITRDSQRQRKQNSQPPFSDAYLSGMPSKRRKVITSAKPSGNLTHVISDSMASALGSAGMGSGAEIEVVAQRASQDPRIRSAFREQVRSTVQSNLQKNPDYKPEKYPNAAKLFDTAKQ